MDCPHGQSGECFKCLGDTAVNERQRAQARISALEAELAAAREEIAELRPADEHAARAMEAMHLEHCKVVAALREEIAAWRRIGAELLPVANIQSHEQRYSGLLGTKLLGQLDAIRALLDRTPKGTP